MKFLLSLALGPVAVASHILQQPSPQAVLQQPPPTLPLRLVTLNIRYAATSLSPGERPWAERRPALTALLSRTAAGGGGGGGGGAAIIGLQEVLAGQLDDIAADLGPGWAHVGVGRDDGARAGEHNPIFFRPGALRALWAGTRWLSPTPGAPSFGWGAACRRVVTAAVLEERGAGGRRLVAANTHLDHVSSEARAEGIRVVLRTLRALADEWGPGLPVVLTGDFNSSPGEDAYRALEESGFMRELWNVTDEARRAGPHYYTYTGFGEEDEEQKRIDFIWVGTEAEERWEVARYEVLDNIKEGIYISDHRPVVGDIRIAG